MNDCLKNKIEFVAGLNKVVSAGVSNIASVEYQIFVNANHEDWTTEFLVVNYVGGAVQARCCSGNSNAAILEELGGMLYSSQHNRLGTNDTNFYKDVLDKCSTDCTDAKFAQKRLA